MIHREFMANGIAIFPLWPIVDGECSCQNPECTAAGKHPSAPSWQHTPIWSDDQIDFIEESGQIDTGYGCLVSGGLLVIDVDARNGGVGSFERLLTEYPDIGFAGLVVDTGSRGGSRHYYFRVPLPPVALAQTLDAYPGIDFKSSGYVVGPGSLHASGNTYDIAYGDPSDIGAPPQGLVNILTKQDKFRATIDGNATDVSEQDIRDMLAALSPDCDYDQWVKIGMSVHQSTSGTGFALWDTWSSGGEKYPGTKQLDRHWHSFGKSTNPVTLGTLYHYATKAGWQQSVTFTADTPAEGWPDVSDGLPAIESIDTLRPPGFVGKLVEFINARSLYPRERLAVAGALTVMSAIAGMRHKDTLDHITPNLFSFGVAASATGKESVLQSTAALLAAGGVAPAIHGGIKSEQEILRNLIHHQAAIYLLDEMGEVLAKLTKARESGATGYLQGVIGQMMSIYSKADSFLPVTGDTKRALTNELFAARKAIVEEHGEKPKCPIASSALDRVKRNLDSVDLGIKEPYLLLFGLTTPGVFDTLMTFDMAANGFMGRSIIFREMDDNPYPKKRDQYNPPKEVPESIAGTLRRLYAPGFSELPRTVAKHGETVKVETTDEARDMLEKVMHAFLEQAGTHSEGTDMTPIPRRGYELVAKVSLLLAIPEGLRTVEHVRWAYALVKKDIDSKLQLTHANSAPDESQALLSRIMSVIDADEGETQGKIRNRCRKWKPATVDGALAHLVNAGHLQERETPASRSGGRTTKRYFITR